MFYQESLLSSGMKITDDYVFFWGDEPFTNFTPCEIRMRAATFHSSEQAFMYCKAAFFEDWEIAEKIYKAESPKEAKKLGRKVRNFEESEWAQVSKAYMEWVLRCKFDQHPEMKAKLLSPEYDGKVFVEASPYDRIWGIGYQEDAKPEEFPEKWGENRLGNLLTELRKFYLERQYGEEFTKQA